MPTRTEEEKKLIDSLPVKKADDYCNARTGKGYCNNDAGFKTDHPGEGRCFLHGGFAGTPIKHGYYSTKLNKSFSEEYQRVLNDPNMQNIEQEIAMTKVMFSNLIKQFSDQIECENYEDIFFGYNKEGELIESPKIRVFIKVLNAISRLEKTKYELEEKSKQHFGIKQVQSILTQLKNIMKETCSSCPVRATLGRKISNIQIEELDL